MILFPIEIPRLENMKQTPRQKRILKIVKSDSKPVSFHLLSVFMKNQYAKGSDVNNARISSLDFRNTKRTITPAHVGMVNMIRKTPISNVMGNISFIF
jgi:hypothetical protein